MYYQQGFACVFVLVSTKDGAIGINGLAKLLKHNI